jgi:hypothetical protein
MTVDKAREVFFFCKKRSKKTFIRWVLLVKAPDAQIKKSFLLLFYKKEVFCLELIPCA